MSNIIFFDHDKYTLDDLLEYKNYIEEAYIFWNVNQTPQDKNLNLDLINEDLINAEFILINIKIDLYNDENKIKAINEELIKNKIEKTKINKLLGCYNATPDTDLVISLPKKNIFVGKTIEAIYFDDGVRL